MDICSYHSFASLFNDGWLEHSHTWEGAATVPEMEASLLPSLLNMSRKSFFNYATLPNIPSSHSLLKDAYADEKYTSKEQGHRMA